MAIPLSCDSCGSTLRIADEHAGKRIRCPKCGEAMAVPRQEPAGRRGGRGGGHDVHKRQHRAGSDDDLAEERRPRQKKRRQPSRTALWVGLGAGALVALVAIIVVVILLTGRKDDAGQKAVDGSDKKDRVVKLGHENIAQEAGDNMRRAASAVEGLIADARSAEQVIDTIERETEGMSNLRSQLEALGRASEADRQKIRRQNRHIIDASNQWVKVIKMFQAKLDRGHLPPDIAQRTRAAILAYGQAGEAFGLLAQKCWD
jgi:predicted RNA-binding Zn-ribbon protein involved in translation (DUF1610 family)